ncbi:MAG: 50S ribosomal protein L25/general stress protein Ctc [Alphaproteobacteria bacterium]
MSKATMTVSKRERAGKGAARAVRREGFVPGVIYGDKTEPVLVQMDPRPLMKGLHTGHFFSTVYNITVEGGKKESVLPREVQFHPVSDAPIHVDFMRLVAGSTINVFVPVRFINEDSCAGIKEGAVLQVVREEVELVCPTDKIPEEVVVDLAPHGFGDTLRYSSATHPEGTHPVISDRDFVVATLAAPKVATEKAEEEAESETPEDSAE